MQCRGFVMRRPTILAAAVILLAGCGGRVDPENPCLVAVSKDNGAPRTGVSLQLYGQKVESLAKSLEYLMKTPPPGGATQSTPSGRFASWITGQTPGALQYQTANGGLSINLFHLNAAACWKDLQLLALVRSRPGVTETYRRTDRFGVPTAERVEVQFYTAEAWVVDVSKQAVVAHRQFAGEVPRNERPDQDLLSYSVWKPINSVGNWLAGWGE